MNRSCTAPLFLGLALLANTAQAQSQAVWRCGPDGRLFQATPCASGQLMDLKPAPSVQARAEAEAVAAREKEALQTLGAERRAREQQAVAGPSGIRPATAEPPARRKPTVKKPSESRRPAAA
ncbi:MAG: hypothetical protein IV093_01790 [Rubrivivax sp.]|nr:hypothetical protein [Rubrivivax sp.]